MTTYFEYTEVENDIDSSLVDNVWFNENTNEVVVDLNGEAYKYTGVSAEDFEALVDASSVGAAFAPFKRAHGPSTHLGYTKYVAFTGVDIKPVAPVANRWTLGANSIVDPATGDISPVNATSVSATQAFDLHVAAPKHAAEVRDYTLTFDVVDGATGKEFKTKAANVNDAVDALLEVGEMLDLTFKVRSATVYFD